MTFHLWKTASSQKTLFPFLAFLVCLTPITPVLAQSSPNSKAQSPTSASTTQKPPPTLSAQSIKRLEAELNKKPTNLKVREQLAKAHYDNKKYAQVVQVLSPYTAEMTLDSLIMLADSYDQSGDHLGQIRTLQLLVERDGERFRPHYLLGQAYAKDQKYDEAAKEFRRAIALAPQHRPSYDALLQIFTDKKQNYESRTLLSDMIKIFGQKKEFVSRMCKLLAADHFIDEALAVCKNAVSLEPKNPDNHIYLAQIYYDQGNKTTADKIFTQAGKQFLQSEFAQYAVGEYNLNDKNYPASVRYLKNAVTLNPKSLRAQFTLARAYFETKEFDLSLNHFIEACRLDKSKESYNELRTASAKLRQKGMLDQAALFERKAETCQP